MNASGIAIPEINSDGLRLDILSRVNEQMILSEGDESYAEDSDKLDDYDGSDGEDNDMDFGFEESSNVDIEILTKMPKLNSSYQHQESWPESIHSPRLIPIEDVVSSPLPTSGKLARMVNWSEEELSFLRAPWTLNPRPGYGSTSFGHRIKNAEHTMKWPESILSMFSDSTRKPLSKSFTYTKRMLCLDGALRLAKISYPL